MTSADHVRPIEAGGDHPLLKAGYKRWLIFVLFLVMVFNFADRAILVVLAQPIKEDLLLSDTELGILQGLGFAILYSVLGLPLGLLAERVNRTRLIAASVAVWSVMTAFCGLAGSFFTLLLGRIGVGIGEAGVLPSSMSLVSDHFSPRRRASMLAIITLGGPFGFLLGQSVGGWIESVWSWRAVFYVMGVPGLLIALLVMITLREPPRGLVEGLHLRERGAVPTLAKVVKYLFAKRGFCHLLLGFTIANFAMNAIATFVLPFYLRSFTVPLATLGVMFGLVTFTSNGIGMLLGGFGFDALSRRDARWSLWGPSIALIVCIPVYFGAFVSHAVYLSLAFVWLGNMTLITFMAPTLGTMQNMAGPRMRATTSALSAMVIGLFGAGLGPTVLGMLSDVFAARSFAGADFAVNCPGGRGADGLGTALDAVCAAASSTGLRYALICMLVMFVWASVHYLLGARHLKADLYQPGEDDDPIAEGALAPA